MPIPSPRNTNKVREDFDEIARLADHHEIGVERYDSFLMSLVPRDAVSVLEVGCGLGRLSVKIAGETREVLGIDLSPEMISRARQKAADARQVSFLCGDFLHHDFGLRRFDCIVSSATLHHLPEDVAVPRMVTWLRPGGRLIIHDMRSDSRMLEGLRSFAALAHDAAWRMIRTGWPLHTRAVRAAWLRHGADETYLTLAEAQTLAKRLLPGSRVCSHWLWRYTVVWDKPDA